jgi:hypothetical protein
MLADATPSPQPRHTLGSPLHVQFASTEQREHPSPLSPSPSSHASPANRDTRPSPHTARALQWPCDEHEKPALAVQLLEQPSASTLLPSSQPSAASTTPLPQLLHTDAPHRSDASLDADTGAVAEIELIELVRSAPPSCADAEMHTLTLVLPLLATTAAGNTTRRCRHCQPLRASTVHTDEQPSPSSCPPSSHSSEPSTLPSPHTASQPLPLYPASHEHKNGPRHVP